MKRFKRLAIYARVSKDQQTVEQQLAELRMVLTPRAEAIVEIAETGSTRKVRPEQEKMVHAALAGEYDAIAVWKTDRFARTHRELVNKVDDLQQAGVAFLSLKEGYDLSTAVGRFVFRIFAAQAELERDMISDRTKAKLEDMKRQGIRLGPPMVKVDERLVRKLLRTMSMRKVAKEVGVSKGVIERVVRLSSKRSSGGQNQT